MLVTLLQNYARTSYPSMRTIVIDTWNADEKRRWTRSLADSDVDTRFRVPTVLLFDEAQMTYKDVSLWNFFKNVHDYRNIYVIGFAAYGSPLSRHDFGGTPIIIPARQRITMHAIDHHDGCPAVGLLFSKQDFDEFLKNDKWHSFDRSFLHELFNATEGHIGAIMAIIAMIEANETYRRIRRSGKLFSWKAFCTVFPPGRLADGIQILTFARGLPSDSDLQQTDINMALSLVVQNQHVTAKNVSSDTRKVLDDCVYRGWLHSDAINDGDRSTIRYFFTSLIHRWFTQWKIYHAKPPEKELPARPIDFIRQVVRAFNPNVLSMERKIGDAIQVMPEAHYQQEFYRASHYVSDGSIVFLLTEYGLKKGRVDFYVPSKQWGIELLRQGVGIKDHAGRFSQSGSYAYMEFKEYILLDLRTSKPRKAHPIG